MWQFLSARFGIEGLLAFYYLVALAALSLWLFFPIKHTPAGLFADVIGGISAIYVFLVTYAIYLIDLSHLSHGSPIPLLDLPALFCIFLMTTDFIPLAAFWFFGRLLGRVAKGLVMRTRC